MATTHRSDLTTEIEKALTDEAYDGGSGALTEEHFSRYVRRLAETAVEVVREHEAAWTKVAEAAATTSAEIQKLAEAAESTRPVCPECRDGKHSICIHQSLSDGDEFIDCACGCEPSRTCPSCKDVVPIGWTLEFHLNCNWPEDFEEAQKHV
ncbi:hypothetical protein [Microbacterium sp. Leaf320]|uniref:hypothetical protein n=1 Tax=Microbacterium sp. Leaf320 TaxID=1736334 RepID=UPI0006FBE0DE|nr:hypothetical protein [Microbacterium sp. Leaf320]KQQ65718.1 hypothetical protein ASF63_10180 [Microbacterium sp. Leaf320]